MTDHRTRPEDRIRTLAHSLPSLRSAPGLAEWQAITLDAWAASGSPSHGERCSARFLLAVWNPEETWRSGRFDLMEALRVWDEPHRRTFLQWAAAPWWA